MVRTSGGRERGRGGRRGRNTQTGCSGAWGIRERGSTERERAKMEGHRRQQQKTAKEIFAFWKEHPN